MKVVIIGSGGREHALAAALARAETVTDLVCLPGNPGIEPLARCREVDVADAEALDAAILEEAPDLVVVGPEAPLVSGLADRLRVRGIPVFGPGADGAVLEGSKAFAKDVLRAAGVRTASGEVFDDLDAAVTHVRSVGAPVVIKADGLAAGKGVVVAQSEEEAIDALERMLGLRVFGRAGARVLIEECLVGPELSVMGLVSGGRVQLLEPARDHKRAHDGDVGPNTGGMGALCPVPDVDPAILIAVREDVFEPVVSELVRRGIDYRGVLYAGLMLCADGPYVIEFNARFGDPEAQAILPRLRSDAGALFLAVAEGRDIPAPDWDPRAAVTVVVAADGYPEHPRTGMPITLEGVPAGAEVFQAGTALHAEGLVVAGGRVASVTALAADPHRAAELATEAAGHICFDGAWHRADIGASSMTRTAVPAL